MLEKRARLRADGHRPERDAPVSADALKLDWRGCRAFVFAVSIPTVPFPAVPDTRRRRLRSRRQRRRHDRARQRRAGADRPGDRSARRAFSRHLRAQQHAAEERPDGRQRRRRRRPGLLRPDRRSEDPGPELHRRARRGQTRRSHRAGPVSAGDAGRVAGEPATICAKAPAAASVPLGSWQFAVGGWQLAAAVGRFAACRFISPAPFGAIAARSRRCVNWCATSRRAGHTVLTKHLLDDNVETAESRADRAPGLRARHRVAGGLRPADRRRVRIEFRCGF